MLPLKLLLQLGYACLSKQHYRQSKDSPHGQGSIAAWRQNLVSPRESKASVEQQKFQALERKISAS